MSNVDAINRESKYRKRENDVLLYTCWDIYINNKNTSDTQQKAKTSRLRLKIKLLEGNKHFKTPTYGKYISHLILTTTLQDWFYYIYDEETEIQSLK